MSNKYFNKDTAPSKQSGGQGGSNAAQGKGGVSAGKQGTANWPGLPGKGGPNRAGGAPTKGHAGEFYVKKEGF